MEDFTNTVPLVNPSDNRTSIRKRKYEEIDVQKPIKSEKS